MAIDTAAKRYSALNPGFVSRGPAVIPSGATSAPKRATVAWLFATGAEPPAGVNPTFIGPSISDLVLVQGVAMTPVDYSSRFSDDGALTFACTGLPTGLTLSSAGVLSGTPTVLGTTTGLFVRATDLDTNTVDSNTFSIAVTTAPGPRPDKPPRGPRGPRRYGGYYGR